MEDCSSVTIIQIDGGALNRIVVRMEREHVYKRASLPLRGHMDIYIYTPMWELGGALFSLDVIPRTASEILLLNLRCCLSTQPEGALET